MKVSFVIPTHDCAAFLPHAVASALEQTHKDIEVVVVDDASTDMTNQYLDWLERGNNKVKVMRLPANVGRSAARNFGNKEAQGDAILVLDADDLALPKRAALSVEKLASSGAEFVYGGADVIDVIGRKVAEIRPDKMVREKILESLQNGIVHSSACYTRSFEKRYPYEDGEIARLGIDDWAQQVRAFLNGEKFDFMPGVVCAYRERSSSVTSSRDMAEVKSAKEDYLRRLAAV